MKKRLTAMALFAALCLALFSGCDKEKVNFIYYTQDRISTLDPQLAATPAELTAVKNMFAGLYRIGAEGAPVPDRAQKVEVSADGLTWTFTLSEEDRFFDGEKIAVPVTAQDYVFALQRALDPATGAPAAGNYLSIRGAPQVADGSLPPSALGVRAVSDYTLEITLSTPDSALPEKLAAAAAMPCNEEFFTSTAGAYGLSIDTILGNGAFQLTGWSAENGLTLRRLAGDEGRLVNRIRLVPAGQGEAGAALQRLQAGEQDGALAPNSGQPPQGEFTALQFETTTWVLLFNCRSAPLSNLSVRQALAAVARLSAEDLAGASHLRAADGLLPGAAVLPGGQDYRAAVGNALYSLADAQAYPLYRVGLDQLGLDRLSGLQVLIPDGGDWDQLYPLINQRWQRSLSAFFSVEPLPQAELEARVEAGDFDLALLPLTMSAAGPQGLLARFTGAGSQNLAGYENAAFDRLVLQGLSGETGQDPAQVWGAAERQLLADAALVPLAFENNCFYLAAGLDGVVVDPFGPVLDLTGATRR